MRYPSYKYFYAAVDFIVIISSFLIAHVLYYTFYARIYVSLADLRIGDYLNFFLTGLLFILIFHYLHLYKMNIFLTRALHLTVLFKALIYGLLGMIVVSFFSKISSISDSRLFLSIYFLTSLTIFTLVRIFLLQIIYAKVLSNRIFKIQILIIGAGKSGKSFAQKLSFENIFGVELVGFLDDTVEKGTTVFNNLKVLGKIDDIGELKARMNFKEVAICIDRIEYEHLLDIIDKCQKLGLTVKVTSDLFGIIPQKIFSEEYQDIPVINVSPKFNYTFYYFTKRALDYLGATIGIILLSPFFITTAILIKLTSKGPVIYKQTRIGKNGKPFDFYKFRSMNLMDGEDHDRVKNMLNFMKGNSPSDKIVNDRRITVVGKLLRKYSLDEIPQLLNVLKGDMSLVGPRPCLPYEYEHYDEWQKRRLSVIPGCTGLWQVSGRSEVNFNDSIVMDLYYINNISPWLDLQLIFKTLPVMLFARGGK
ncbi:MAG: sugar transferase [Bacteroidetes bacterium]|nr:sugar transferase [Bacteroidota bacterium]